MRSNLIVDLSVLTFLPKLTLASIEGFLLNIPVKGASIEHDVNVINMISVDKNLALMLTTFRSNIQRRSLYHDTRLRSLANTKNLPRTRRSFQI